MIKHHTVTTRKIICKRLKHKLCFDEVQQANQFANSYKHTQKGNKELQRHFHACTV